MATFAKYLLSGSVDGRHIPIVGTTSGSATALHTTPAGTGSLDEVWIYLYNDATSSITASILWGGITESRDVQRLNMAAQSGRTLVIDGKLLTNGKTVSAYAALANWINVDGFVNRIT